MTILSNIKFSLLSLSLLCITQLALANERKNEYNAISLAVIQESTLPLRKLNSHGFDLTLPKQRKDAAQVIITTMITILENKCPTAEDFIQARSMLSLSEQIYDENKIDKSSVLETSEIYWRLARRVQKDITEMDAKDALCDIDLAIDRMKK